MADDTNLNGLDNTINDFFDSIGQVNPFSELLTTLQQHIPQSQGIVDALTPHFQSEALSPIHHALSSVNLTALDNRFESVFNQEGAQHLEGSLQDLLNSTDPRVQGTLDVLKTISTQVQDNLQLPSELTDALSHVFPDNESGGLTHHLGDVSAVQTGLLNLANVLGHAGSDPTALISAVENLANLGDHIGSSSLEHFGSLTGHSGDMIL